MNILEYLAATTPKNPSEIQEFLQNAPRKYKVYKIPKRTYGFRTIAHPIPELKEIQRQIVKYLDQSLPIHPCAMAYIKGKSIKQNAFQHHKSKYLLKLDFENFFNSINNQVFWAIWDDVAVPQLSAEEKSLLENILFWCPSKHSKKRILSIGAPSSPYISNFCMYPFDKAVYEYCLANNVTYTRYADDLTFSTNSKDILFAVPHIIQEIIQQIFKGSLRLNSLKTKFSSKAHNRHVTGITITNDKKLSIGRNRKRYIKSMIYRYTHSGLDSIELSKLKGLLCFANDIEPIFIKSLKEKYSTEIIDKIFEATHDKL